PAERLACQRRHACYFYTVLSAADGLYRTGGDALRDGWALFDLERRNVDAGQRWAAEHATADQAAEHLCARFPGAGIYILSLRLPPSHVVVWLEAALTAA